MQKVNRSTCPAESWGERCSAFRLLAGTDLAVAEEVMPAGTSERRHVHAKARQFFYVLAGRLTMAGPAGEATLGPGDGLEIAPGVAHRAHNPFAEAARFLVISAPTTEGDRTDLGCLTTVSTGVAFSR